MDLSKVISISGMGGLFKVVAQSKNGLIVESYQDQKRIPVQATNKINVLDNISIYLNNGETAPLEDFFKKMHEKLGGNAAPDHKAEEAELVKVFAEALPDYDKERVHSSDIRKAIHWYNILQKTDIFTAKDEEKKDDAPLIPGEQTKKPERSFQHDTPGKHMGAGANVPKKPIGVRKTGTA